MFGMFELQFDCIVQCATVCVRYCQEGRHIQLVTDESSCLPLLPCVAI